MNWSSVECLSLSSGIRHCGSDELAPKRASDTIPGRLRTRVPYPALDEALSVRSSAEFIQQRDGGDQPVVNRLNLRLRPRVADALRSVGDGGLDGAGLLGGQRGTVKPDLGLGASGRQLPLTFSLSSMMTPA